MNKKDIKNKIPPNWSIKKIGEILKIKHGKTQKEIEVLDGKYPILATGGVIGRTNTPLYSKPSVLIGRKGTIDKPQFMETPFWTVDTLFYSDIKNDYHPKWVYYYFCTIPWRIYNEATGVPSLSASTIESIKIKVPTYDEQVKIANILSTWDKAIELKEKLIEQKKEQKKGFMQRLLTGQVRLPGFDAEWHEYRIKDICDVVSGGTPSTKNVTYWNGNIPWCTPTDITSSGKYITQTKQSITEQGLKNSSANLLPKDSILMCSRATIGPRAINKVEMATNQGFKSFVCNKYKLDYEFFYYLLSIYIPYFIRLASGSTFLEVSKKDVENTKVFIPNDLNEQKEIATIIGNIDKSIELLEREVNLLKEQKKGLMQLLLTGKVRVKV